MNYDIMLFDAKRRVTTVLCSRNGSPDLVELASAIDDCHKAWDALTDCLVRQKEERDAVILDLINQLAEAKRNRTNEYPPGSNGRARQMTQALGMFSVPKEITDYVKKQIGITEEEYHLAASHWIKENCGCNACCKFNHFIYAQQLIHWWERSKLHDV